jgi:hypothetical protein
MKTTLECFSCCQKQLDYNNLTWSHANIMLGL